MVPMGRAVGGAGLMQSGVEAQLPCGPGIKLSCRGVVLAFPHTEATKQERLPAVRVGMDNCRWHRGGEGRLTSDG